MSDRRISKKELEAFWRGDKDTYQRMYSDRMQQKADEAEKQGKQVTYIPNDGSATLPEISITAPRETKELRQARLKLDYENLTDNAITIAGFIPGADTFADIADIGNSWRKGDYSGLLWGLAGLGLPVSGKALKSGWNWFKNLPSIRNYKAAREISSAINDNVKDGIQVGQYYHGSPSRNITNFKLGKDGGIYWTHNKDAAKLYTGLFGTGKVYNADLNLGDKIVTINNNGLSWTKIPENEVAKAFNLSTDQVHDIIGSYNLGATPWHYGFTQTFGYKPKTNYYSIDLVVKLGKNQGISSLVVNNVTDNGKRLFSKTMPYDQTIIYNPGQVRLNKNQTPSLKLYGSYTTYENGPYQLGYTTSGVKQIGIPTGNYHWREDITDINNPILLDIKPDKHYIKNLTTPVTKEVINSDYILRQIGIVPISNKSLQDVEKITINPTNRRVKVGQRTDLSLSPSRVVLFQYKPRLTDNKGQLISPNASRYFAVPTKIEHLYTLWHKSGGKL